MLRSVETRVAAGRLPRTRSTILLALLAIVLGVATIKAGGAVIFGGPEARAAAGDYVPFVVWFNFVAGFAYVTAAIGLLRRHRWAVHLATVIAASTAVVLAAFGLHAGLGGAWKTETLVALTLRLGLWLTIAVTVVRAVDRSPIRTADSGPPDTSRGR